jgi:hypothetical protein
MVGLCQVADGGFATMPGADDADLRMTYCAFVVCALLDNWSCIDLPRALSYIHRCRVRLFLPPPSSSILMQYRRTKAGTDRRQMASRSADRHTAPSQLSTSHPHLHHHSNSNNTSNLPNGARRYGGSYRPSRPCSSEAVLQGARTSYQMHVTDSGAAPRFPYVPLSPPFFSPLCVDWSADPRCGRIARSTCTRYVSRAMSV